MQYDAHSEIFSLLRFVNLILCRTVDVQEFHNVVVFLASGDVEWRLAAVIEFLDLVLLFDLQNALGDGVELCLTTVAELGKLKVAIVGSPIWRTKNAKNYF